MRILYRHALDVMEKQRTYLQPLSLDDALASAYPVGSDNHLEQGDPHEHVAEREALRQAFAQLSAEQRRVIALRYGADLTEVDIAQVLDWPVGTVKSRLNRVGAATSMGRDELDVLLATGLARSICARKLASMLTRFLLASIGLLAGIALIVCWMHHLPLVGAPVALALWAVVVWCWQAQARSIAFRADTVMVRWLGRGLACHGLHKLAEHSRALRRRRWGDRPSSNALSVSVGQT